MASAIPSPLQGLPRLAVPAGGRVGPRSLTLFLEPRSSSPPPQFPVPLPRHISLGGVSPPGFPAGAPALRSALPAFLPPRAPRRPWCHIRKGVGWRYLTRTSFRGQKTSTNWAGRRAGAGGLQREAGMLRPGGAPERSPGPADGWGRRARGSGAHPGEGSLESLSLR